MGQGNRLTIWIGPEFEEVVFDNADFHIGPGGVAVVKQRLDDKRVRVSYFRRWERITEQHPRAVIPDPEQTAPTP